MITNTHGRRPSTSNRVCILAAAAASCVLLVSIAGCAAPLPADFGTSTPPIGASAPPLVATGPDETPTKAEAEAHYVTHLGPSLAWRRATPAEREVAEAAYLAEYGSWNNGCRADLKHAYQGVEDAPTWVQAGLPVNVITSGVLLGDFVEGACGE